MVNGCVMNGVVGVSWAVHNDNIIKLACCIMYSLLLITDIIMFYGMGPQINCRKWGTVELIPVTKVRSRAVNRRCTATSS